MILLILDFIDNNVVVHSCMVLNWKGGGRRGKGGWDGREKRNGLGVGEREGEREKGGGRERNGV